MPTTKCSRCGKVYYVRDEPMAIASTAYPNWICCVGECKLSQQKDVKCVSCGQGLKNTNVQQHKK